MLRSNTLAIKEPKRGCFINLGSGILAVKFHHSHDEGKTGTVFYDYVKSAKNSADLLTKALGGPKHAEMTCMMSLSRDPGGDISYS
jgi:hypothetical protein